jgi:hypothetical protein
MVDRGSLAGTTKLLTDYGKHVFQDFRYLANTGPVPLSPPLSPLRVQHGVSAAAWRPANDATPSGIQVRGNIAGSADAPGTFARSLCRDKCATPAADPWQAHRLRWYAERVPWEVMTPLGPPGEDNLILLGPSALDPLSLSIAIGRQALAASRGSCNEKQGKTDEMPQTAQSVMHEGNREGDAAEMLWAGRRPPRPK